MSQFDVRDCYIPDRVIIQEERVAWSVLFLSCSNVFFVLFFIYMFVFIPANPLIKLKSNRLSMSVFGALVMLFRI